MEQKALLALNVGEWVLITDDEGSDTVWRDEEPALLELKQEGWTVDVGPSVLHAEVSDQPGGKVSGYVPRLPSLARG